MMIHDLGQDPVHWFDDSDYAEYSTDLGDSELSPDGSRLASIRGYGIRDPALHLRGEQQRDLGPAPGSLAGPGMTGTEEGDRRADLGPGQQAPGLANDEGV